MGELNSTRGMEDACLTSSLSRVILPRSQLIDHHLAHCEAIVTFILTFTTTVLRSLFHVKVSIIEQRPFIRHTVVISPMNELYLSSL